MKSQAYPINKTAFFIQNDMASRFLFVLWGNAKRRHPVKSAALSYFSTLRARLARRSRLPVFVIVRRFFHGAEVKQLMAGGGIVLLGMNLIPPLANLS